MPQLEYLSADIIDHAPLDEASKGKFRVVLEKIWAGMEVADVEECFDKYLKWRELSYMFYQCCGIEGEMWDSMPTNEMSVECDKCADLDAAMGQLTVDNSITQAGKLESCNGSEFSESRSSADPHSSERHETTSGNAEGYDAALYKDFMRQVDAGMCMSEKEVCALVDQQLSILGLDKMSESIEYAVSQLAIQT